MYAFIIIREEYSMLIFPRVSFSITQGFFSSWETSSRKAIEGFPSSFHNLIFNFPPLLQKANSLWFTQSISQWYFLFLPTPLTLLMYIVILQSVYYWWFLKLWTNSVFHHGQIYLLKMWLYFVESVENFAIILKKFKKKNLEDFFVEFTYKFIKKYR